MHTSPWLTYASHVCTEMLSIVIIIVIETLHKHTGSKFVKLHVHWYVAKLGQESVCVCVCVMLP